MNDLHTDNIVLVGGGKGGDTARVFFVDFSHSILSPTPAQCVEEINSLHAVFAMR